MRELTILHYHVGGRVNTDLRGIEAGIGDLGRFTRTGLRLLCGCPYQHHAEPYIVRLRDSGARIVWTIGATERPYANAFGKGHGICWDCEGGGDPSGNAAWFRELYRKLDYSAKRLFYDQDRFVGVYSGFPPPIKYDGQTCVERYGCDWDQFSRWFALGYAHPMPLPTACCGGLRGPLPAKALINMPPNLPVLLAIASPNYALPEAEQWAQVREDTRDRLAWIKCGKAKDLLLVKAVDAAAGARWTPQDSRYCAIIGEELANV